MFTNNKTFQRRYMALQYCFFRPEICKHIELIQQEGYQIYESLRKMRQRCQRCSNHTRLSELRASLSFCVSVSVFVITLHLLIIPYKHIHKIYKSHRDTHTKKTRQLHILNFRIRMLCVYRLKQARKILIRYRLHLCNDSQHVASATQLYIYTS